MLKTFSTFLLILFVACLSCSKEEALPSYTFTVAMDAGYFANYKDAWIILHDKDGKAIAEGQLLEGQSLKFTVKEKKVGITIMRVDDNTLTNLPSFQLETFLNVNAAATWTLKKNQSIPLNCGSALGNVEVIVSDPNIGNNLNGVLGIKGGGNVPDMNTSTSTSMRFLPLTLYAGCNNAFLYVLDKNRVPHYKLLENVNPGQYAYTISQLNTFDKVLDINYKETSSTFLVVTAFEAGQSVHDKGYLTNYTFGDLIKPANSSSLKVGYLNRFPKYFTNFWLSYPGYSMYYSESGGIPSAITMPETLTATISDKTISGYSFSVNEEIVYRQVSFGYYPQASAGESGMNWIINSGPENDFKNLAAAPTQFMTKYPTFKIENAQYFSSSFYKEHPPIDNIVSQRFGGEIRPETSKSIYKTFYN